MAWSAQYRASFLRGADVQGNLRIFGVHFVGETVSEVWEAFYEASRRHSFL